MAEADHFDKWEAADDAHRERVYADFHAFDEAVKTRGSIVGGDALDRPTSARTVRPGDRSAVRPALGGFAVGDIGRQSGVGSLQMIRYSCSPGVQTHRAVYPPSTTSSLPVTNFDSSDAR